MKRDRYELIVSRSLTTFEFLSEGRKGKITSCLERIERLQNRFDECILPQYSSGPIF
jgi:hypothetical protein